MAVTWDCSTFGTVYAGVLQISIRLISLRLRDIVNDVKEIDSGLEAVA